MKCLELMIIFLVPLFSDVADSQTEWIVRSSVVGLEMRIGISWEMGYIDPIEVSTAD